MTFYKKLKKSQKIYINHYGEKPNDCITIFTTIRQYPSILDFDTCKAVDSAIDHIQKYFKEEATIHQLNGVSVQVLLISSKENLNNY